MKQLTTNDLHLVSGGSEEGQILALEVGASAGVALAIHQFTTYGLYNIPLAGIFTLPAFVVGGAFVGGFASFAAYKWFIEESGDPVTLTLDPLH